MISVNIDISCNSLYFFFFQAEDGIRDKLVTGVQTCALPIFTGGTMVDGKPIAADEIRGREITGGETRQLVPGDVMIIPNGVPHWRSEERRVGKEGRSRWSPYH